MDDSEGNDIEGEGKNENRGLEDGGEDSGQDLRSGIENDDRDLENGGEDHGQDIDNDGEDGILGGVFLVSLNSIIALPSACGAHKRASAVYRSKIESCVTI